MNIKEFLSEQSVNQKELLQALQQLQQDQGISTDTGQQPQAPVQQAAPAVQQKAPEQTQKSAQQPAPQQKPQPKKAAQAFTPQQEAAIKQIVQKMINDMLKGSVDAKL